MRPSTRRQLSLYVPDDAAVAIEAVRRIVDPVQHRLIPAHVTLCREDELARVAESDLIARLMDAPDGPITLRFGPPRAFSGHGILIDCVDGEERFVAWRARLLAPFDIRRLKPHITLAHPRNVAAAGTPSAHAAPLSDGITLTFPTVRLIEQEGTDPWRVLRVFEL